MSAVPSLVAGLEPRLARPTTVSDALVALLADLGVRRAFVVAGGAVASFCHALDVSALKVVQCRHESGAAFAAAEASFAGGGPGLVVTTTGPGLTNALTGIIAAKFEGAKVILVSGATPAAKRGRWAFQETSAYALPLFEPAMTGAVLDLALSLDDPAELVTLAARLEAGFARPQGFVAHVRLPHDVQALPAPPPSARKRSFMATPPACSAEVAERCARTLTSAPFGIWVGFGARHASAQVRELAARTGAAVMCSPRGKGIFPEDHPRFVGVTGFAGHESVRTYLAEERPARLLVLGTRLGEFTSFWAPEMIPPRGLLHVDIDSSVPGTAYPGADVEAVHGEIGAFLDAVLARLPNAPASPRLRAAPPSARSSQRLRATELHEASEGPVDPRALMAAVQRIVVDRSDATVLTEAGNAFAWGNHALRFSVPGRYRVSMGFGSMGQAVAGVIGTALGRSGKAVAIVGDGAMLMNNEVSTAVEHAIPAVWIVLNDSRNGMIEQGMDALGIPFATGIPRCNFAAVARAMGATGLRVERESELADALEQAMACPGPVVVDVVIDPTILAPSMARFGSLREQWSPDKESHE